MSQGVMCPNLTKKFQSEVSQMELYLICHKMSNVKKSNTLTMDEVHKNFNLTQ